MNNQIFYIVDVFTDQKYAGNQLAVFKWPKELTDAEMLKITKEMNYSETTFILSDKQPNQGYDVRIFTPEEEVPFAGHPTLGTAYIIHREIREDKRIILNLKVGQIPVNFEHKKGGSDILWMEQKEPSFGKNFDINTIFPVLNLKDNDIDDRFPIQDVSTGLPFIIIPLKSLDAVKRANVDRKKYLELIKDTRAKAILIFCPQTYHQENDLNVRVFVEYYGIPEDPATGSGNGCLAAYLCKYKFFGKSQISVRVEQGYEIGRPSLIYLKAEEILEGRINVSVGGSVVLVAKGELV